MQIFVKIYWDYGRTIVLDVTPKDTGHKVLQLIYDKMGRLHFDSWLQHSSKHLYLDRTLESQGVYKESTLHHISRHRTWIGDTIVFDRHLEKWDRTVITCKYPPLTTGHFTQFKLTQRYYTTIDDKNTVVFEEIAGTATIESEKTTFISEIPLEEGQVYRATLEWEYKNKYDTIDQYFST